MRRTKKYIGDSVYAEFDGCGGITLTTENIGAAPSNTIYLEPDVLMALNRLIDHLEELVEEEFPPQERK
jgi:hypothetical protein